MKPRIYLSAPISGRDYQEVRQFFGQWKQFFTERGYPVVSPLDNGLAFDEAWSAHMRADIRLLLDCDTMAVLSDKLSPGMKVEKEVAEACGIKFVWGDCIVIAAGHPDSLENLLTP